MERSGTDEIAWSLGTARSGVATLSVGGRRLHSEYDPEREAERFAAEAVRTIRERGVTPLVLVGAGLGWIPSALSHAGVDHLVWDPFPRMSAALGVTVPDPVLDPESLERALDAAAEGGRRAWLSVHPGLAEICGFEARAALRAIRRRAGIGAPAPERIVVSQRGLEGLERLSGRHEASELASAFSGQTVVIASPGPSLAAYLEVLREREGGVVLAAPQSLPTLAGAGVHVDAVVAPDPRDFRHWFEDAPPAPETLLIADTATQPALLDRDPSRTYLFHLRSPQLPQLAWDRAGRLTIDEPLVSVSETALFVSQWLGAGELALLGVDLASDDPRYAIRFETPDPTGRPVVTNSSYHHSRRYLDWRCPKLERSGIPVWRPQVGLPIQGTRALDPAILRERLAAAPRFVPPTARATSSASVQAVVRGVLQDVTAAADAGVAHESPLAELSALPGAARLAACRAALAHLASERDRRRRDRALSGSALG